MSDQYQPVPCELHSNFELWIMHQSLVDLAWFDENSARQSAKVVLKDIYARDGVEYVSFIPDGQSSIHEVRLDKIASASVPKIS